MATFKKLQVTTISTDFRKATTIFEQPIPTPGPNQILLKNHFSGVNATDINISAARYFTDGKVPFDIGFESLGEIEAVGRNVTNFKVGQPVMSMGGAGYSEYLVSQLTAFSSIHFFFISNVVQIDSELFVCFS